MKKLLVMFSCLTAGAFSLSTQAKVVALDDCSQLSKPKTVLVVHASDCHFCVDYMPKYTHVSNEAEFKDWTFYQKLVNLHTPNPINVCGTIINGVPETYTHNMAVELGGDRSVSELENFLRASI